MNCRRMGESAIQAHILSAVYVEYKGNPRGLARDSGACQRAASYWLEGNHSISTRFLLNLASHNEKIQKTILYDLVARIRETND
jgi:hypothetical protein